MWRKLYQYTVMLINKLKTITVQWKNISYMQ